MPMNAKQQTRRQTPQHSEKPIWNRATGISAEGSGTRSVLLLWAVGGGGRRALAHFEPGEVSLDVTLLIALVSL
ncbi:unnamed protein product [Arctogadus glacialis]